jgi:riboflavin synthase
MFSGIVVEVGRVDRVDEGTIRIACRRVLEGLVSGASVAVNGVCLTAARIDGEGFEADVMPETLRRTTLGELAPGAAVNLEPALRYGQEVGGHLVQGHVDGVGVVVEVGDEGNARWVNLRVPEEVAPHCAVKGSIAVDGASLTIAAEGEGLVSVSLIPHTLEQTIAREYRAGTRVNLEADVLAKYVARHVAGMTTTGSTGASSGGHQTGGES